MHKYRECGKDTWRMKPPWIDQGWLLIARSVANRGVHPPPTTSRPSLAVPCTLYRCSPVPLHSWEPTNQPTLPLERHSFPLPSLREREGCKVTITPSDYCAATTDIGNPTHPRIPYGHGHHFRSKVLSLLTYQYIPMYNQGWRIKVAVNNHRYITTLHAHHNRTLRKLESRLKAYLLRFLPILHQNSLQLIIFFSRQYQNHTLNYNKLIKMNRVLWQI